MNRRIATYEQAIEFLYGRINYERVQTESYTAADFKLGRMAQLLEKLGHPEEQIPALHIAGTKGKGTTASITARILTEAGYRVGLFTSPHINLFEERLRIDGRMPSQAKIVELTQQVARVSEEMDKIPGGMAPTFFELTMALAWLWFREESADIVVLEVGLGGRLDATNLCRPLACAITSISRDHTALLGNTLLEIATEKAGIIKPGVPVVSGVEDPHVSQHIEQIAKTRNSQVIQIGREVTMEKTHAKTTTGKERIHVQTPGRMFRDLSIPFAGAHQARNAAVAVGLISVLEQAGWDISEETVRLGLANVECPLRIELVHRAPDVILDVAHNWASTAALLETLASHPSAGERILIFAASRDKDIEGMLRQLLPAFPTIIVTQFLGNPRAFPFEATARLARSLTGRYVHTSPTPAGAWRIARRLSGPSDLICGTGSFFIAAELREIIQGEEPSTRHEQEIVPGDATTKKGRQQDC